MPSSWWIQATAFEAVRLGSTPSGGTVPNATLGLHRLLRSELGFESLVAHNGGEAGCLGKRSWQLLSAHNAVFQGGGRVSYARALRFESSYRDHSGVLWTGRRSLKASMRVRFPPAEPTCLSLGCRLTVGPRFLVPCIGVRFPAPQLSV